MFCHRLNNGSLKIWDPTDGSCRYQLKGHSDSIMSLAVSLNGSILAASSGDSVRLWDITTGACKMILCETASDSRCGPIVSVRFSPSGTELIGGGLGGVVKFWDITNGTCNRTFDANCIGLSDFAISRDNRVFVILRGYMGIPLWDLATGTQKELSREYSTDANSIALTSDGKSFIAASRFGILSVWDVGTGVFSFSDDNQYLNTNQGRFKMSNGVLDTSPDSELSRRSVLYVNGPWVMRNGQKLLQLPPGYKEISDAVRHDTLALTDYTGQIVFGEFSES
ncbi:hypothetical protein N7462_002154 [Penicillium macrosclerotiorum]|uniref:uncharacterized protein n=1 Tax=Penicillium macrosclerotiorum TaxID=303699 RepID=UPI00254712C4|nr:uncharacterized protein N7462_002154 [Penicillium macrosclerotiorum]KAJ5692731.1 hypothetical protein N7462_002154 [Penicillium macrosclerotiorum]